MKRLIIFMLSLLACVVAGAQQNETFSCDEAAPTPFAEGFEETAIDSLPDCWTVLERSNAQGFIGVASGNAHDSLLALKMYDLDLGDHPNGMALTVASPRFEPLGEKMISFWAKAENNYMRPSEFSVGVVDEEGAYYPMRTFTLSAQYQQFSFIFDNFPGGMARIGFRASDPTPDWNAISVFIDDIEVLDDTTSCRPPTQLQAQAVGDNSLFVSWTDDYGVGSYTLCWGLAATPEQATDSVTLSNLYSYTITPLANPQTTRVWIRSNCGETVSRWRGTEETLILCLPIEDIPYTECFEGCADSTLPACWQSVLGNAFVVRTADAAYQGQGCLKLAMRYGAEGYGSQATVALPEMESLNDLQLSFMASRGTGVLPDVVSVGLLTDLGDYLPLDTVELATDWQPYTIPLTDYASLDSRRLALHAEVNSVYMYGEMLLDSLTIGPADPCPAPTRLRATNITDNSITLTWRENGLATQWEVAFATAPLDDPALGQIVIASSNTMTLSNLQHSTTYYIYVNPFCMETRWSGPLVVSTACQAVTAFPFEEGFESALSPCWEVLSSDPDYNWDLAATGAHDSLSAPHSGQANALFFTPTNADLTGTLLSPTLDLTQLAAPMLTFWMAMPAWGLGQDELTLLYRADTAEEWQPLAHYGQEVPAWTERQMLLPNPSATYQIAFQATSHYGHGVALDDIRVAEAPDCLPVVNLALLHQGTSSLDIDWEDQLLPAEAYAIEYGPAGFTLGEGSRLEVGSHPATLGGLDSLTAYDIYVRPLCADPDSAAFTGPLRGRTQRCDDNCLLTARLSSEWGYGWYDASIAFTQGSYSEVLEISEEGIFDSIFLLSLCTGEEVSLVWHSGEVDEACGFLFTDYNGDTLCSSLDSLPADGDTLALFLPSCPLVCLPPQATVSPAGHTSALALWNGGAGRYELSWRETSSTQWGEPVEVEGLQYTLSHLIPGRLYQLRLRALCDEETASEWSLVGFAMPDMDCSTPTGLSASSDDGFSVRLDWEPLTEEEQWMARVWNTLYEDSLVVTEPTARFGGLLPGSTYQASVRALCAPGALESGWTEPVAFQTHLCEPVNGITVSSASATSATISWSSDADRWTVNYGPAGHTLNTGETLEVTGTPSCTLSGLEPGETYDVVIQTVCAEGWLSASVRSEGFRTAGGNGVLEVAAGEELRLWPNPCGGELRVECGQWEEGQTLAVVDLQGRVVLTATLTSHLSSLNLSALPAGTYFVKAGQAVQRLTVVRP